MAITVRELLDEECADLKLELLAGKAGLGKSLASARIQKPGLLLTGLLGELHADRVQILGAAEINYLNSLEGDALSSALSVLEKSEIPAIIVTRGLEVPDFLTSLCDRHSIALFRTPLTSSGLIAGLTAFLEERLAPTISLHGVLVDVLGIGILIIGKSGIGKSECALDLVSRGHRLVADDVVIIKRMPPATLFGTAAGFTRYHMEIRGLGIVNIQDIFGITAIREKKQMDLVAELVKWESTEEYERIGLVEKTYSILDVPLPYLKIPMSPGRSVASIVEVAARNHILKIMGRHPARELEARLNRALRESDRVKA